MGEKRKRWVVRKENFREMVFISKVRMAKKIADVGRSLITFATNRRYILLTEPYWGLLYYM